MSSKQPHLPQNFKSVLLRRLVGSNSICIRIAFSPGSHKSNLAHPALSSELVAADRSAELVEEGIEVHLDAGDCVLLVDCMLHGSARKRTPGERRVFVTVSEV